MIINIRGTSGAGKTTLVKAIMELYGSKTAYFESGRKRPIGYVLQPKPEFEGKIKPLALVGHYEIACGGCDTITSIDKVYELVNRSMALKNTNVLFEGLLISAEVNRTLALHKAAQEAGNELRVMALDLPLEICLDSVNSRRRAKRGEDAPGVNPKNTASKHKATLSTLKRLSDNGVWTFKGDRESVKAQVMLALGFEA